MAANESSGSIRFSPTNTGVGSTSSATTKNITVARKVNKLLDIHLNEELKTSLHEVEGVYEQQNNNATGSKQRKQLRYGLEMRVLKLHQTFLKEFAEVREGYNKMSDDVDTVQRCCDSLDHALKQDKDARESLLSSVSILREELLMAKQKEEQVKLFMEQYQLSPEEQNALKGEVCPAFVTALGKAKSIHDSCKSLLTVEHQQAAVEVMETMYLTQMAAAEKLLRHLIPLTSELLTQDVPHVTPFYVEAIRVIQDKPSHWAKVIHEVSRVRRVAVLRQFYDVLASAAGVRPGAVPQDSARFLSDLLAWLHQCIAEEADVLAVFFPTRKDEHHVAGAAAETTPAGPEQTITMPAVLDQIFECLCKHLGDKVDSTIDSIAQVGMTGASSLTGGGMIGVGDTTGEAGSSFLVHLFKIEGLLRFYADTTTKLLGERAALSSVLHSKRLNCLRVFFDTLKLVSSKMLHPSALTPDYAVPPTVQDVLLTLKAMMDSLQVTTIPHSERETEFNPVLGAVADPLPAAIDSVFANQEGLTAPLNANEGKKIFRINVFSAFRSTLSPYTFTMTRQGRIEGMIAADVDSFVQQSVYNLLTRFGFSDGLVAIARRGPTAASQQDDEGDGSPAMLRTTLHGFYSQLYSSGTLTIPFLEHIQTFHVREMVRKKITANVCEAYEVIYKAAMEDVATTADSVISKNTPAHIRLLLEVEGKE